MTNPTTPVVFDGHNDVLSKLAKAGGLSAAKSFSDGLDGHIDLPKAEEGGLGGGFFAVWVPSIMDRDQALAQMSKPAYDMPLPDPIGQGAAMQAVMQQAAILFRLESQGDLKVCKSATEIDETLRTGRLAAIFHIEGAEAIGPELYELDVLHQAGLRSLGPVWSRDTIFGHGVPFRFPSDGDIGPGLSDHGRRLIRRCNELRIMVDLSHLNAKGFWDVADISDAPLVATHSNAHAICPHSRNLTDDQLRAIADSDGMVGLNYAVAFLRPDGGMLKGAGPEHMLRHLDHLIGILGEDRVGFGSDYDGAVVPEFIATAAKLPKLREAMAAHGYDDALIAKLCHKNWLRVLKKTWGT